MKFGIAWLVRVLAADYLILPYSIAKALPRFRNVGVSQRTYLCGLIRLIFVSLELNNLDVWV